MRLRLLALLGLLFGTLAHAEGLAVSPILIPLDDASRTALVKLTNGGASPERYQLEMKAWSESRSGQMELTPTKDVIFFPQMLALGPGESRNVRVGIASPPSAVERSYRLFIQELPKARAPGEKAAVQVLTRVGIPIFVSPKNAKAQLQISAPTVTNGDVKVTVTNPGNAYARPESVSVSLLDGQGGKVFQKTWSGWYILANGARDYAVKVPPEQCKKGVNLRAEVLGEGAVIASQTAHLLTKACGP